MFPLGISKKCDLLGNSNWTINKREVVLSLPIVSKCIDYANSIGQKKNATKIIDIAKSILLYDKEANISFDLLEYLLLAEPCYIRFDNDSINANKYIHPKRHLDVNFSVDGTYKIGVYNNVVIDWIELQIHGMQGNLNCPIKNLNIKTKRGKQKDSGNQILEI